MKLLFVVENANLNGGTEILTFHLLSALRAAREDVYVLSIVPYVGKEPYVLSLSEDEYYKWRNISLSLNNKLLFSTQSDRVLRKILTDKIKKYRPVLLVCQTYDLISALPLNYPVAQVFNWSVIGYEASLRNIINKKTLVCRTFSMFCEWGKRIRRHRMLSKVSKLIVLTESAQNELRSLNPKVRDEQIQVIPDLLMVERDSDVLSSLKNGNVSFVGRLSYEKGVMRLLRIWKQVYSELPNFTLSIYGEGDAREEMEKYIKENCINNVCFKGYCNDLERIYPNSDLLLMTSDTEGFGMVLIEAMYYGVPCISFDCPISPKEIISDAGVLIPSFDEDEYAKAIVSLVSSKEQMKTLQNNAIMRARDFYKNKIISKWLKIIRD